MPRKVIVFWAGWHEPSKHQVLVATEAAKDHPEVEFETVDAEADPALTRQFPVRSVPTMVFLDSERPGVQVLEGAHAPSVAAAFAAHADGRQVPGAKVFGADKAAPAAAATTTAAVSVSAEPIEARLAKLVKAAPVMLFMKGSPNDPKCGFSRTMIGLLREVGAEFGFFDILTDDEVRQGLKAFSNWPTYPQLYVNGELLGGLDVVKEMHAEGELKSALASAKTGEDALNARLAELVKASPVMLFMKGSPDDPKCGFSRTMVGLLAEVGAKYGHFDILTDNEVRQGLKAFSNWPTYPQLYVDGELLGGLDVVKEMHAEGELKSALPQQ